MICRPFARCCKLAAPVYIPDTQSDARWLSLVDDSPVRSWLGLPLFSRRQDEILGILNVDNHRLDAYNAEDIQTGLRLCHAGCGGY